MVATISNQDFYSGQNLTFSLKATVAQAGGTLPQLNLFNYLLTPSLLGIPKTSTETKPHVIHDCRAGSSLLLLFPPRIQMALSVIFYVTELQIKEGLSEVYDLTSQIVTPAEVMQLHQHITNPLGSTFLSALASLDIEGLQTLLRLDTKLVAPERLLRDQIADLLPQSEDFGDIATNNDRYRAAIILAERFNYKTSSIQAIANITELWLLQNSSI